MAENVIAVEQALRNPDPWEGFCEFVLRACRAQAADRGLADLLAIGHSDRELESLRERAYRGFNTLIDAAKRTATLRADFTAEDLVLLLMANSGIMQRAGSASQAASERFVALALDGYRGQGAGSAPPAPSPDTLIHALREVRRSAVGPAHEPVAPEGS